MPSDEASDAHNNKTVDIKSILGSSNLLSSANRKLDSGPIVIGADGRMSGATSLSAGKSPIADDGLGNILGTVISGSSRPSSRNSASLPPPPGPNSTLEEQVSKHHYCVLFKVKP